MFINRKKHSSSDDLGRTMIEMIAVIGLISMIAIGAYGLIANIYAKFRVFKTRSQYREIVENVRRYYANDYDYTGLTLTFAIDNKMIPNDAVVGTDVIFATGSQVIDMGFETDVRSFYIKTKATYFGECLALLDMFIDQVGDYKSSYKVIHDTKKAVPDIITYSWEGNKTDCSLSDVHLNCVSVAKNAAKCTEDSEITAYYY